MTHTALNKTFSFLLQLRFCISLKPSTLTRSREMPAGRRVPGWHQKKCSVTLNKHNLFLGTLFSQCIYISHCWDTRSSLFGAFVDFFFLSPILQSFNILPYIIDGRLGAPPQAVSTPLTDDGTALFCWGPAHSKAEHML